MELSQLKKRLMKNLITNGGLDMFDIQDLEMWSAKICQLTYFDFS
jgi:hypothetical protein